jgi:Flp pilus assembly protein TadD
MRTETAELLHCLGYVYLRQGQLRRAAVLLMLAARDDPSAALLRTLALALIGCNLGEQAMQVLDRAEQLDPAGASLPLNRVLRARALLALGRREEARVVFRTVRDAA